MLPWLFLGAAGLVFILGLARLGLAATRHAPVARGWAADLLLLAALVPVALFAVHPYLGVNLVGAGDSYHYGLQVADFVAQIRAGVMPVLVGQSDYAFNGNIHTLRTAPYFTHLAGLLDILTGRSLSFVALQNLTVATTSVLAAWAAALTALRVSGGRRVAAGLLAAIYVLSPAIMGPLALNDMFATYMAAPWLVLCWGALAGILRDRDDLRAQWLAAGALGLAWYAHPPVAAWLSLAWVIVQGLRLLLAGGEAAHWGRQLAAGLCLLGLTAYVFVSVALLGPGPQADIYYHTFSAEAFSRFLRLEFTPFSAPGAQPGIQLGWSLWLLLLLTGVIGFWRRPAGVLLLLAVLVVFLPCLVPLPVLSDAWWRVLPGKLVGLTYWSEQRLCPLLASGIVIAAAAALRAFDRRPAPGYRTACGLLACAAVWSLVEVAAIHRRPGAGKLTPADHQTQLSPDNLRLTRYAYALFERPPAYYSHGWVDPEFESRLLDENLDPATDNSAFVRAAATTPPFAAIHEGLVHDFEGPGDYLLEFAFADPASAGEVTIRGAGFERFYTLPSSGGTKSFGSGSLSAKTIPLRLTRPGLHQIVVAANFPGASVRIIPFQRDDLPVRVFGQVPYTARVRATAPGFLETPRVFIDGYAATVDGSPVPVRRSPEGLIMIPVPAGESRVELTYPGSTLLRAAWLLSLACFAGWPWLLRPNRAGDLPPPTGLGTGLAGLWRQHRRRTIMISLSLVLFGTALFFAVRAWRDHQAYGSLRLVLELPKYPVSRAEPLLTLGRPGAADCIYVIYEDARHIRLGLDHWSYGGPVSAPIEVSFGRRHTVEITLGGLYPASPWSDRSSPPTDGKSGTGLFQLRLNEHLVFSEELPFFAAPPAEVVLGRNPVGSSVAGEKFTGRIISSERFIASPR